MPEIRQLFSHKALWPCERYLRDGLGLLGSQQDVSGEQDLTQKQNYTSLRQLPKNTWMTKGTRMPGAGQVRVLGFYSSVARFALAGLFLFWLALFSLNSTIGKLSFPPCLYIWVQERWEAEHDLKCCIGHELLTVQLNISR